LMPIQERNRTSEVDQRRCCVLNMRELNRESARWHERKPFSSKSDQRLAKDDPVLGEDPIGAAGTRSQRHPVRQRDLGFLGCSDGGLQSAGSGLRCRSDPRLSRGDRRCQSRSRSSGGGCQRDPSGEADFECGKSRGSGSDHRSRFACTGSGDGGSGHSTGLGSRSRGRWCQRHSSSEADLGLGGSDQRLRRGGGQGRSGNQGYSDLRLDQVRESAMNTLF
jgi:hypothetical protein